MLPLVQQRLISLYITLTTLLSRGYKIMEKVEGAASVYLVRVDIIVTKPFSELGGN
jgi:hypothetical protein